MSEKLNYKLDAFEGPLDLLLFLIQKHKLNICDINISELLEQYTESIKDIENFDDMDGAAEFLEMAARLVYIKTAMLLPRYDDEGEKLRQELQGELIEYQTCKLIATELKEKFCGNSIVFYSLDLFFFLFIQFHFIQTEKNDGRKQGYTGNSPPTGTCHRKKRISCSHTAATCT